MEETLKTLISFPGACGFEHNVARYIYDRAKTWADTCFVDGVGNVVATKKGKFDGPTLVIAAHMDEVGFIVKKIEENGLIRFEKLGGHDDRILLAQQVVLNTEKGILHGVIGTISCHMMKFDNDQKVRKHSEMYIDVGVDTKEEVEKLGIQVGDPVTWATKYQNFGNNRIIGKGFDDRAGCAVLLKAMEETDFNQVHGTVHAVFSVQEEVGLRGAKVAGQQLKADLALAIDTTAVSDTPEEMMDQTLHIGKGPGIKVMDFSLIASVPIRKKLVELAKQYEIPYQLEVFPGIGTDGGELALSHGGIPTGVISIPSRYAHSPVEVIDLDDVNNSKKLLIRFIENLQSPKNYEFI